MNMYSGGVWPVMLTPFTEKGEIDPEGLCALVDWYISSGVSGLFAACQSSEIYYLSLDERKKICELTLKAANGRVPVIGSGHVSDDMDEQVRELSAIAETGVDAVITISNHFAKADEDDSVWFRNLETLLGRLDGSVNLGIYECPAPYKRLLTDGMMRFLADTGRFYFMKDTCCDSDIIAGRLRAIEDSNLRLYNANSTTLLETLRMGAHGFSGVMANMHPEVYVWLCDHIDHPNAGIVSAAISAASLIERQYYPTCAKYHLREIEGLPITTVSRTQDRAGFTETFKKEVRNLDLLMNEVYSRYCL